MKRPLPPDAPTNAARFAGWLASFAGYRDPVTQLMIEQWLEQFSPAHKDLAARVLDSVLFLGNQHIRTSFRELLHSLDGWHNSASKRKGKWFFVPFSGSVGESGDSMVHVFRMATGMASKRYNDIFVHRSDLVRLLPGPNDTVVLIDDFSASGSQACESWKDTFSELLPERPKVILMLIAATTSALDRIMDETQMEPVCGTALSEKENFFDEKCKFFDKAEKESVLDYCKTADSARPRGWDDGGLLVVFAHRCPNNSLPILHSSHHNWRGLFPRHD